MFYVKYKGEELQIRKDTVYNKCPRCGKEVKVDLDDLAAGMERGASLLKSGVYCDVCGELAKAELAEGRPMTEEEMP
ncbi:hypothetical protein [Vermiculatibacterium agrestimuris]|uniref:hypothetical protein n=1 Tax=Vermiculatibacterium agrestimuris TaxID=2941519 RepID=UPI00203A7385|nr:hypothetical protein [Vermiculatibacterium agrestimuris]